MKKKTIVREELYESIKRIIESARKKVNRAVNSAMVEAYWLIGRLIVEEEQKGAEKAKYGAYLIRDLSKKLTNELGKGFTSTNLKYMRKFYLLFKNGHTPCDQLSWSHYRLLIRIENEKARKWYEKEAVEQNWSVRVLNRQINSLYYQRLIASKYKESVIKDAEEKTIGLKNTAKDVLKDPYILEFLDIADNHSFRESELEQAIIDKLQDFLLELGKGFAFVARQKRISTETSEFYIDLVFYNFYLKCFVLIDLKTGILRHQDIGQMDMYVRIFDDLERGEDDNPTVGVILCTEKDETIVKYSVLKESIQLFASKYMLYLPKEEELEAELRRERRLIEMKLAKKAEEGYV